MRTLHYSLVEPFEDLQKIRVQSALGSFVVYERYQVHQNPLSMMCFRWPEGEVAESLAQSGQQHIEEFF